MRQSKSQLVVSLNKSNCHKICNPCSHLICQLVKTATCSQQQSWRNKLNLQKVTAVLRRSWNFSPLRTHFCQRLLRSKKSHLSRISRASCSENWRNSNHSPSSQMTSWLTMSGRLNTIAPRLKHKVQPKRRAKASVPFKSLLNRVGWFETSYICEMLRF